jgi:hypothetical protein
LQQQLILDRLANAGSNFVDRDVGQDQSQSAARTVQFQRIEDLTVETKAVTDESLSIEKYGFNH